MAEMGTCELQKKGHNQKPHPHLLTCIDWRPVSEPASSGAGRPQQIALGQNNIRAEHGQLGPYVHNSGRIASVSDVVDLRAERGTPGEQETAQPVCDECGKLICVHLVGQLERLRAEVARLTKYEHAVEELRKGHAEAFEDIANELKRIGVQSSIYTYEFINERAESAEAKLRDAKEALRKLADGGGDHFCECDHDTPDCCANTDYYCPVCIAGAALAKLEAK